MFWCGDNVSVDVVIIHWFGHCWIWMFDVEVKVGLECFFMDLRGWKPGICETWWAMLSMIDILSPSSFRTLIQRIQPILLIYIKSPGWLEEGCHNGLNTSLMDVGNLWLGLLSKDFLFGRVWWSVWCKIHADMMDGENFVRLGWIFSKCSSHDSLSTGNDHSKRCENLILGSFLSFPH